MDCQPAIPATMDQEHQNCKTTLPFMVPEIYDFSKTLAANKAKNAFDNAHRMVNSEENLSMNNNNWRKSALPNRIIPEEYGMKAVSSEAAKMNFFQALSFAVVGKTDEENCIRLGTREIIMKDHVKLLKQTKAGSIDDILCNNKFLEVQIAYAAKFLSKKIVAVSVGENYELENCKCFFPEQSFSENESMSNTLYLIYTTGLIGEATSEYSVYVEPLLPSSSSVHSIPCNLYGSAHNDVFLAENNVCHYILQNYENPDKHQQWVRFCLKQKRGLLGQDGNGFENRFALNFLNLCSSVESTASKFLQCPRRLTIAAASTDLKFKKFVTDASAKILTIKAKPFGKQYVRSRYPNELLGKGVFLYCPEDIIRPFFACIAILTTGCEDDAATIQALVINSLVQYGHFDDCNNQQESISKFDVILKSIFDAKSRMHDFVFRILVNVLNRPIERYTYNNNGKISCSLFTKLQMNMKESISVFELKSDYFAINFCDAEKFFLSENKKKIFVDDIDRHQHFNEFLKRCHDKQQTPIANKLPLLNSDLSDISSASSNFSDFEKSSALTKPDLTSSLWPVVLSTAAKTSEKPNHSVQDIRTTSCRRKLFANENPDLLRNKEKRPHNLTASSDESTDNAISCAPAETSSMTSLQYTLKAKTVKLSDSSCSSDQTFKSNDHDEDKNSITANAHVILQGESQRHRTDLMNETQQENMIQNEQCTDYLKCAYRYSKELFIVNGKIEYDYAFYKLC